MFFNYVTLTLASCGAMKVCEAGEWAEWGECEAECGEYGQMTRTREVNCPEGIFNAFINYRFSIISRCFR